MRSSSTSTFTPVDKNLALGIQIHSGNHIFLELELKYMNYELFLDFSKPLKYFRRRNFSKYHSAPHFPLEHSAEKKMLCCISHFQLKLVNINLCFKIIVTAHAAIVSFFSAFTKYYRVKIQYYFKCLRLLLQVWYVCVRMRIVSNLTESALCLASSKSSNFNRFAPVRPIFF
jgi:hypothetical protein